MTKLINLLLVMHHVLSGASKNRLDHECAVTVWDISLVPVCADCMQCLSIENGQLRKLVGEVVAWLYYVPCPNKKWQIIVLMRLLAYFGNNLNLFLTELALKAIDQVALKMLMPFMVNLLHGMRYEMHSLPFPEVPGFVVHQTTSKHFGIGSAELIWSHVKTTKNGKLADIGGELLKKSAILYPYAKHEEAQILRILLYCSGKIS